MLGASGPRCPAGLPFIAGLGCLSGWVGQQQQRTAQQQDYEVQREEHSDVTVWKATQFPQPLGSPGVGRRSAAGLDTLLNRWTRHRAIRNRKRNNYPEAASVSLRSPYSRKRTRRRPLAFARSLGAHTSGM